MMQFAVLRGDSEWEVFEAGLRSCRYADRLEAIEDAYLRALAVEARGQAIELLVQDEGGQLEEWRLSSWPGNSQSLTELTPA